LIDNYSRQGAKSALRLHRNLTFGDLTATLAFLRSSMAFLLGLWIARQVTIRSIHKSGLPIHSLNLY